MKRIKSYVRSLGVLALSVIALQTEAALDSFDSAQCPVGKPLAQWDFDNGDLPSENNTHVNWWGNHDGIKNIPETNYKGIKFGYRGKGPEGDSSSEWRYKINIPLSRTWEYLKIYQPKSFYHRHFVRIKTSTIINETDWPVGSFIENSRGMTAEVGFVKDDYLFIKNFPQRFDKNWGNNILLTNKKSGAQLEALDSRNVGTNNKFSAQWQGKYSNAGMIVEFESYTPSSGGEPGVGYIRPTVNRSKAHKASGTIKNNLAKLPGSAFNPKENSSIVEFVIERVRSSNEDVRDGSYRVWKRTESTNWHLVFSNTNVYAWQEDNYFDHGYVFGWANSGYSEDTDFYLLGWALWAEKPSFL